MSKLVKIVKKMSSMDTIDAVFLDDVSGSPNNLANKILVSIG